MEQMKTENTPDWLMGKGQVDEVEFCRQYYMSKHIIYCDGAFFSPEGRIADESVLRNDIYEALRPYIKTSLSAKVERILGTLRMEAAQDLSEESLCEKLYTIPTANGTYRLDRGFVEMKYLCRYRLPVNYNPDAPKPEAWLRFLDQLLYEEDIPTLQEYMGYCLIPCTLGQKMLILTGKGGEGKSRIGVVMKALLGCNMNIGSIAKVEKSPFARADLEHLLVMVDDDLKMEALDQTNYLKSIITAELPMDLERKGVQSYQGTLNVRFMAFGNSNLQALHDRSNGFFRRQILLQTRERPPQRKDDPYLASTLVLEKEGILLWCIEGLERLILHDFKFSMSRRARENLLHSMFQSNNVMEFMRSQGYIHLDPEGSVSSKALYEVYQDWCTDNSVRPLPSSTFLNYLNQNLTEYNLKATKHLNAGNGRQVRGFCGIRLCSRF